MYEIIHQSRLSSYYDCEEQSYAEAADSVRIDMRLAYGQSVSLATATCLPGYHPAPQVHASEQINYIADGELWVYIDGVGYFLQEGDSIRVPQGVVHWMWNRSNLPCTFFESNCPPLAGQISDAVRLGGLVDNTVTDSESLPHVVWLSDKYSREIEEANKPPVEGPLMARAESLVTSVHAGAIGADAAGKLTSKCIHGIKHNMTIARRKGGYHSAPHIHDAEQLHFVIQGNITIYRDDRGFACKEAGVITESWHFDGTYYDIPPAINILAPHHLPEYGGDTMWSSQYHAYETLSERMKALLAPLRTRCVSHRVTKRYELDKLFIAEQPAVRLHPVTGRPSLYIGYPETCESFVGMTRAESQPLIQYLHSHANQPDNVYRHNWKLGDIVVWDNRCNMHFAVHDYREQKREMYRMSIKGERNIGIREV